ncbi:hypothetical protein EOM39_05505 [Candidatus Gracilibacteria bacterium]|nr:hypothetical protein [Candidatus Gracilibacteria bacterium]
MLNNNNKSGYSIIIAIFVIGFLLALTSSILKLVIVELNDNRGVYNYLKTHYATMGAGEMVMMKIKDNGYGYYEKINFDKSNPISNILNIDGEKNPIISYDINSKVKEYDGSISPLSYDVIPLFYIENNGSGVLIDMDLSSTGSNLGDLSWNIISSNGGLSGEGGFTLNSEGYLKQLDQNSDFLIDTKSIGDFLSENNNNFNYLVLFNSSENTTINYNLDGKGGFFTKPRTEIAVSSKIGSYKQNISIKYDNTEYLGMLKYSIYND